MKAKTKEFAADMKKIGQLDGITYADVVFYDTKVFKNTDRPGQRINGGTSYEEHLGGAVGGQNANGEPENSFLVKQLRRQIAAKQSGQTSRDLYLTGSYKRPSKTSTV